MGLVTLKFNKNLIQGTIGKQGSAQCGVYSVAYGFTILEGKCRASGHPASHQAIANKYNNGNFAVCYWGSMGVSTHMASSVKARYKAILEQLQKGKPVVAAVKGTGSNHYVCVIGYNNSKNANNIKGSDFYIIDPAQGDVNYYGKTAFTKGYNNFNGSGYGLQYVTFPGKGVGTGSSNAAIPVRKATCAADVRAGAVAWAKAIAKDNSFHYGKKPWSTHGGCYFCGTNQNPKGIKARSGGSAAQREKTYCCNPFVFSAYAHGGGDALMKQKCKNGRNSSMDWNGIENQAWCKQRFKPLGKPTQAKLIPGDILCYGRNSSGTGHMAMYAGDGYVVESGGGDDGVPNSKKWNNSIRCSKSGLGRFTHSYRYIGNGGGVMEIPGEDYSGVDGMYGEVGGGTIDMSRMIETLVSSENYAYLSDSRKDVVDSALDFTAIAETYSKNSGAVLDDLSKNLRALIDPNYKVNQVNTKSENDLVKFLSNNTSSSISGTSLLSYPSLVEAPYIEVQFGSYVIGPYKNSKSYPNYLSRIQVDKINAKINQYEIELIYQIQAGQDPNFIDKLVSTVGYNPIKIKYGDSAIASGLFREESAIITGMTSSEDQVSSRISYTIKAISASGLAKETTSSYPAKTDKPSNVVRDLLYHNGNDSKALLEYFPGMKNQALVESKGLLPNTDVAVNIGAMRDVDPLQYLNHLVTCMTSSNQNGLGDSSYYICYENDNLNEFGGAYFKIQEVTSYNKGDKKLTGISGNVYEVDVGYPGDNFVTNFEVLNDQSWSLIYESNSDLSEASYIYNIDNDGNIQATKTESQLLHSKHYNNITVQNKNWWTQVTQFPIQARITLKGLMSPVMLMSYIKVNTVFYGMADIASGIYVVTKQTDTLDANGYKTQLTLLRISE